MAEFVETPEVPKMIAPVARKLLTPALITPLTPPLSTVLEFMPLFGVKFFIIFSLH